MQSAHTRMRRAVETENRDIETKMGGDRHQSSRRSSVNNKGSNRSHKRRRKPINLCLLLIVLSPLVVIGALVFGVRYYAAISGEIETMQAQGTAAIAKLKRLRNGQVGGQYREEREREESRQESDDGKEVANRKDSSLDDNSNDNSNEKNSDSGSSDNDNDNDEPSLLDNNNNNNNNKDMMKNNGGEFLVLLTEHHGNIRIRLRPDLSPESVDYVHRLVESYDSQTNGGSGNGRCMHCKFYRADKPGILQGIMAHEGVVPINTVRGNCPDGAETVPNDCPEWDPDCGCHGPVMKRGAVAWAAGEAGGPDFFIDAYPTPAKWWGTQHTNFGSIDADDHESLAVVDAIFDLPIESTPQMDLLKTPIHFDLALESE